MLPLDLQTNPVNGIITIVRLKSYSAPEKETGVTSRGESQMMSVCSTFRVSTTGILYVECMEMKPTSTCRRSTKKQCDKMVTVIQTVHIYIYIYIHMFNFLTKPRRIVSTVARQWIENMVVAGRHWQKIDLFSDREPSSLLRNWYQGPFLKSKVAGRAYSLRSKCV